jgi:ATP-dependent RNA helicase DbpA
MVSLILSAGRSDKLRAGDVLGALTGEGGVAGEVVGKIAVRERDTYVAVSRGSEQAALSRLASGKVKGRSVKARLAELRSARKVS